MVDLLDEFEAEARARSGRLEERGRLRRGFAREHYPLRPRELRAYRRARAALALADGPDVFVALCNGQAVPRCRLRPDVLALLERWPK
jgi:hypothetical protein